ncbi:MAG TPA: hypothetical protein PLW65_31240, partial [Pseudomonadota bacterium]|nr:hypothetical protein [Pseudomonadota bacterium]
MEVVAKVPSAEHREGDLKLMLKALSAFRRGEPGVTLPADWDGLYGRIAAEFNDLTSQVGRTGQMLKSVAGTAGSGGRTSRRIPDERL